MKALDIARARVRSLVRQEGTAFVAGTGLLVLGGILSVPALMFAGLLLLGISRRVLRALDRMRALVFSLELARDASEREESPVVVARRSPISNPIPMRARKRIHVRPRSRSAPSPPPPSSRSSPSSPLSSGRAERPPRSTSAGRSSTIRSRRAKRGASSTTPPRRAGVRSRKRPAPPRSSSSPPLPPET